MSTEMEAGRELDALVAEKVMGWTRDDRGAWVPPGCRPLRNGYYTERPGCYSTDIAAAWRVVEAMRVAGWYTKVEDGHDGPPSENPRGWHCRVSRAYDWFEGWADTAPLAICRAALAAVGAA